MKIFLLRTRIANLCKQGSNQLGNRDFTFIFILPSYVTKKRLVLLAMPWQEMGWGCGSCSWTMFRDESGNASDTELSLEWAWQRAPHGKDAASVLPSTSSTKRGRDRLERGPSPSWGAARVCRGSERGSSAARPAAPCQQPSRWAGCWRGGAASSGMQHGRRPQQCCPKRCLHLFPSRSSKPVLFCCGRVGGEWGRVALSGFFKNIRRQQGAGTKDLSFPEENTVSWDAFLPLSICKTPRPVFCPLSAPRALRAWPMASQGVFCNSPPLWGPCFISSAESDRWPCVLLTSGTSPQALSLQLLQRQGWSCLQFCLCWGSWDWLFTASSENKNQMTQAHSGGCSCAWAAQQRDGIKNPYHFFAKRGRNLDLLTTDSILIAS